MLQLLAGCDQAYIPQVQGKRVLISYVEKTQHKLIAERAAGRVRFLMLDNGAFKTWNTGKPACDVAAYAAFVLANLDGIDVAIALDVIPGEKGREATAAEAKAAREATAANLAHLVGAGIPKNKLAPVIHRANPCWREDLEAHIEAGFEFVCVGGCVGGKKADVLPFLEAVIEAAAGRVKLHLLGLSKKWTRSLEAFSCDSTTWLMLAKNRLAYDAATHQTGIEKNAYIVKGLAGYRYHRTHGLAAIAGAGANEGWGVEALRAAAAEAMSVKAELGECDSFIPDQESPEFVEAVTWLVSYAGLSPEDGPVNPYYLAADLLEGELAESWDHQGIDLSYFTDMSKAKGWEPASREVAEACFWPWGEDEADEAAVQLAFVFEAPEEISATHAENSDSQDRSEQEPQDTTKEAHDGNPQADRPGRVRGHQARPAGAGEGPLHLGSVREVPCLRRAADHRGPGRRLVHPLGPARPGRPRPGAFALQPHPERPGRPHPARLGLQRARPTRAAGPRQADRPGRPQLPRGRRGLLQGTCRNRGPGPPARPRDRPAKGLAQEGHPLGTPPPPAAACRCGFFTRTPHERFRNQLR